jgi:hypothetical protein
LASIVDAWGTLPEDVRRRVLAIIGDAIHNATTGE